MSEKAKKLWSNPEHRKKMSLAHKGKKTWNAGLTKEMDSRVDYVRPTIYKVGQNSLDKHPGWKGGISKIEKKVRKMPEYLIWRTKVFERDEWTCQTCHSKGYVTAHHIKAFTKILKEYSIKILEDARLCSELWDINNGVALCEECHKLTDNYGGRSVTKVKNGANSVNIPTEISGQRRAK
jgi:hypothetical protein